jgi:hypothetical protein
MRQHLKELAMEYLGILAIVVLWILLIRNGGT